MKVIPNTIPAGAEGAAGCCDLSGPSMSQGGSALAAVPRHGWVFGAGDAGSGSSQEGLLGGGKALYLTGSLDWPLVPGLPPRCLGILWRQQMELQKRLGQCLEALRKGLLLLG